MNKRLLDYFKNDNMAAEIWSSKYQLKDEQGNVLEETPDDMHHRLAKEFARIENNYRYTEISTAETRGMLSEFGRNLDGKRKNGEGIEAEIFEYFKDFKYIIPQGSIMSILGNPFKVGSLSNCYVIDSPADSYGGIMKADEELVQLMKRRGGVGLNLNTLRPAKTAVSNAAGSSTGAESFMHRYSNSTREVAQDGRRGALMLMLDCRHPDIFKFVTSKKDRSKVTGANISVQLTDEFMKAAKSDKDFICRFPISVDSTEAWMFTEMAEEYNKLYQVDKGIYLMKIRAKELFDLIIEMAWENAEPGLAFIDRVLDNSPDGVYELYKPINTNPCGKLFASSK